MTRSIPLFLALSLALVGCSSDGGSDGADGGADSGADGGSGGGSDGGSGGGSDGGSGGAGPDGQADIDNPSTGYDYFVAFGYRACELYEECTPAESAYLTYEECIEQVDLAAQYYDLAFGDCTFDVQKAEACWQLVQSGDCDGYAEGEGECQDDVWDCP